MADTPFTTSLPVEILRELERAAKESDMKKKEIIAEALTMWNEERKQNIADERTARLKIIR